MNKLHYYYDPHKDVLIVEGKEYPGDMFREQESEDKEVADEQEAITVEDRDS